MKKNKKILLGVAVVAALGLFLYNENKKKKKGEGYSNITGIRYTATLNEDGSTTGSNCRICERPDGSTYFAVSGSCESGHKCITSMRYN